jgi:hypothetical protein
MPDCKVAPPAVLALVKELSEPRPMRRGTFSEQYLRCNRPGCSCEDDVGARHGPYYRVVRVVKGKTQSRHVPAGQADDVRLQVEAGRQFRKTVDAFWSACEQWAEAIVDPPEAASEEVAKKGGSKRSSTRRSSPRSKRS